MCVYVFFTFFNFIMNHFFFLSNKFCLSKKKKKKKKNVTSCIKFYRIVYYMECVALGAEGLTLPFWAENLCGLVELWECVAEHS